MSACADDGNRQVGERTIQRRLIDAGAQCEDLEPVASRRADLVSTALAQQRAKGNRTRAWLWTPAVRPRSTTATRAAVEKLWKEHEVFTGLPWVRSGGHTLRPSSAKSNFKPLI